MITSGLRPLSRANPCYVANVAVNLVVNLVILVLLIASAAR